MSTLTKVLIVLQTVFSVFLCGIVITYVANADNFKEKYNTANRSLQSARQVADQAKQDHDEFKKQKEAEFAEAGKQIQALKDQIKFDKTRKS